MPHFLKDLVGIPMRFAIWMFISTFVLDAGMNSGRTAEFLEIHNNTVQYRLKKANDILGAEMTANRIIPGLTMALAIKRLEEI